MRSKKTHSFRSISLLFFLFFLFLFSSSTPNHVHTFSSFLFFSYFAHPRPPLCSHTHSVWHNFTQCTLTAHVRVCFDFAHTCTHTQRTEYVLTPYAQIQTQTQTHIAQNRVCSDSAHSTDSHRTIYSDITQQRVVPAHTRTLSGLMSAWMYPAV